MWRRMYHVTHWRCITSIIETGLDPAYSNGKLRAVWLADSKRLHWAIGHVAVNNHDDINDLWVCAVHVDPRDLKRWRWPGIYLAEFIVPIYEMWEASAILERGPIRLVQRKEK